MSNQIPTESVGRWHGLDLGTRWQWYGAFVLLNLMDIWLTLYLIVGGGVEANPVGHAILERGGWAPFVSFKMAQCALVLILVELVYSRRPKAARLVITAACGVYLALMGWDVTLILRLPHPIVGS